MIADKKPTLDEQYPNLEALSQGLMSGRFSEYPQLRVEAEKIIQRLKAIDAVQVPEQPREGSVGTFSEFIVSKQTQEYIDTLLDLLRRETARADHNAEQWEKQLRDGLEHFSNWSKAERQLAAMLKLGENPSEGMDEAGDAYMQKRNIAAKRVELFKAMFAKLVEQSKEQSNGY